MRYIIVSVPKKLVNIFKETKAPSALFGGKTENNKTINPAITTKALKIMALPEWCIVSWAESILS